MSCFGTGLLVEMFLMLRQKACQVNPFCPSDPEALRSLSPRSAGIQCSEDRAKGLYRRHNPMTYIFLRSESG